MMFAICGLLRIAVLLGATIVIGSSASAAATLREVPPDFLGVWMHASSEANDCRQSDWNNEEDRGGNDALFVIKPSEEKGWENSCEITKVKDLGTEGEDPINRRTIEVWLQCGGEGTTNQSNAIWHIETLNSRKALFQVTLKTFDWRDDNGKPMRPPGPSSHVQVSLQCR